MSFWTNLVKPSQICSMLEYEPHYNKQRERVSVLMHEGWVYWDKYQAMKPYLFWGSVLTFALSGYGWYKRGLQRRKVGNTLEANLMYPGLMALSAGTAYITRPAWLFPSEIQKAEAQAAAEGEEGAGMVKWIDERAVELRKKNPNFVDDVWKRTIRVPGIKGVWDETPEHIKAMVYCGDV